MNIQLSEQQINNLNTFLQRATLSGAEVPAYLDLINTINQSIEAEKNVSKTE